MWLVTEIPCESLMQFITRTLATIHMTCDPATKPISFNHLILYMFDIVWKFICTSSNTDDDLQSDIYLPPNKNHYILVHPDISGFLPIIIPLSTARQWRRSTLTSSSTPDGWVLSVMLCSLDATSPCCLPGGYRHGNRDHPGKNCGFQRDFPVAVCFFEKIERVAF